MASSVDIVPSLGLGVSYLQEGPGISTGYGAIDRRRMLVASGVREGLVHENAYKVTAAGTGMTVSVAASAGMVNVQGDSVAYQGVYVVAPAAADATLDIAAAHATLPRNDLVVLEVLDNVHDSGGLNKARVRVITGTPSSGAARTDAFGTNGTPTPGASQYPLAVIGVPATDTVITTSQVDDRRYRTWGKSIIATSESRTNAAYGLLTTPDTVRNIVLPTDGLIAVGFQALWQFTNTNDASAALFIGGNQLSVGVANGAPQTTSVLGTTNVNRWTPLSTFGGGLQSVGAGTTDSTEVTTGQVLGLVTGGGSPSGGVVYVWAAAGTYDISIQFRTITGSVTVKNRKLWVWTQPFPA